MADFSVEGILAAASASLNFSMLKYVGACGILQIVLMVILNSTVNKGGSAEMRKQTSIYRDVKDPLMMYYPLGYPFVAAILLHFVARVLLGASGVSALTPVAGVSFSLILWLFGSAHGIFLDYSTMRIPFSIILSFYIGSFANAVANGYMLGYWF